MKFDQWDLKNWSPYLSVASLVALTLSKLLKRQRTVAKRQADMAVETHEFTEHPEDEEDETDA